MNLTKTAILLSVALTSHCLHAADNTILPPIAKWSGKSESLIQSSANPWQTPAEASDLTDSPSYKETMRYLTKLVNSEDKLHMTSLGKSPQNRDIWFVIASNNKAKTPEQLKSNGKPTLYIQAGIHSGEIDGKDAGLMLLRDITKGDKGHLLDKVNILFLPIFNVDGHERTSEFNRVNQRGPKAMGWRTNAQNLNLNRDYAKADTVEMQLLMESINTWQPDLYLDVHVTDGEDYQYDVTYGFNGEHGLSPNISQWLANTFRPQVDKALADNGHIGGPLTFGLDNKDFSKGIFGWTASLRFSNGWGDARHLPTILIENHSLKPYRQRVLGTYIFLEQAIHTLEKHGKALKLATQKDQNSRPKQLPLAFKLDKENPEFNDYKGIEFEKKVDSVTGIKYVAWNGKNKIYKDLPTYWSRTPVITTKVPSNFYIPAQHQDVIKRLHVHGIQTTTLTTPVTHSLVQLTASKPEFGKVPFEGHMTVKATFSEAIESVQLPAGTVKVSTDQPLGKLATSLLTPQGPDSFFFWGFFNQMFQRTEYIESYVMIPLAHKMFKENPTLKAEFDAAFPTSSQPKNTEQSELVDSQAALFSGKREEKMRWLYERSKYYDKAYMKYPVLLEY